MPDLLLKLASIDESPSTVERHTARLGRDLSVLEAVNVRRPPAAVPEGAKSGGTASVGELVLTGVLSASTVAAVTRLIADYLKRHAGRSVTVRRGETDITLTGQSQRDQLELLRTLLAEADDDQRYPPAG